MEARPFKIQESGWIDGKCLSEKIFREPRFFDGLPLANSARADDEPARVQYEHTVFRLDVGASWSARGTRIHIPGEKVSERARWRGQGWVGLKRRARRWRSVTRGSGEWNELGKKGASKRSSSTPNPTRPQGPILKMFGGLGSRSGASSNLGRLLDQRALIAEIIAEIPIDFNVVNPKNLNVKKLKPPHALAELRLAGIHAFVLLPDNDGTLSYEQAKEVERLLRMVRPYCEWDEKYWAAARPPAAADESPDETDGAGGMDKIDLELFAGLIIRARTCNGLLLDQLERKKRRSSECKWNGWIGIDHA
ncbi:hypothetical protein K438DRAFT_1764789 [Mycena galopus ATCC 62051]|nr:hypothetical protein K438DRAFT_1764789 [Mycena galopus ATCC 62051]